jgi:hypothetical protein
MLDMKTKAICACYFLFIIVAILSQLEISWHKFTSIQMNLEIVPEYFSIREIVVRIPTGNQLKRNVHCSQWRQFSEVLQTQISRTFICRSRQMFTFNIIESILIKFSIRFYHQNLIWIFSDTGGPRRRWKDNIKMDLQEVGCEGYGLDRASSG